jgi:hypothetical protein
MSQIDSVACTSPGHDITFASLLSDAVHGRGGDGTRQNYTLHKEVDANSLFVGACKIILAKAHGNAGLAHGPVTNDDHLPGAKQYAVENHKAS